MLVEDVNDEAPAFDWPVYEVAVDEDAGVGDFLVKMTARQIGKTGTCLFLGGLGFMCQQIYRLILCV